MQNESTRGVGIAPSRKTTEAACMQPVDNLQETRFLSSHDVDNLPRILKRLNLEVVFLVYLELATWQERP